LFVGEFTRLWSRLRPLIETEVQAQSIGGKSTLLLTERNGTKLRQQGATALVFQGLMSSMRSNPVDKRRICCHPLADVRGSVDCRQR
jgi:hypothetical protein